MCEVLKVIVLILGLTLGLSRQYKACPHTPTTPRPLPPRTTVPSLPAGAYHRAAVATDYGPCSDMGRDILQEGGSAVDAAITATLCLGVASPQSSGLGGGLFMVIYKSNGTMESIEANEAAPAAADFEMFADADEANYGAKAVSVPGELAGLWAAHQRYGMLQWERLVRPVIDMAENGFPLAWHTEYALKQLRSKFDRWPKLRELYERDGSLMREDDTVTAPVGMVQTLRAIADDGASAFYNGEVGRKLVQDIRAQGGIMTTEDLASYSVVTMQPLVLSLEGSQRRVLSAPVTSSGNLVQFVVSILDECDLASVDFSTYEGKLKMYHYFIEASRFAYAFRIRIGDADTAEVDIATEGLASKEHARRVCSMIDPNGILDDSDYHTYDDLLPESGAEQAGRRKRSPLEAYRDDEEEDEDTMLGDTSHLSVYSEQGDAVSVTTSVGRYFGSRTFSNQTGIFFNGHMGNFYYNGRTPAWEPNKLMPGARAMSSMGPSIITDEDGSVKGVFGSSGGLRIISTNAWAILRMLWGTESLSDMIDTPRVYVYNTINKAYYEQDFPENLLNGLEALGHNMVYTSSFAAAQGILREPDTAIYAHSDRRKHGYPAGY